MLHYPYYFDRSSNQYKRELIFEDRLMRFLFHTRPGNWLFDTLLCHKGFSRFYGRRKSKPSSLPSVQDFIDSYHISEADFELSDVKNFNDFFARRFRPGVRTFDLDSKTLPAFCEGRYLGHEKCSDDIQVPVKGQFLRPKELLSCPPEEKEWERVFEDGPLLIARLAPVDYHRFHFPDSGRLLKSWTISGKLYSVNPLSLATRPRIFLKNERVVNLFETENFGKMAYIEVGAFCVGRIVQSFAGSVFQRGDEKGYFLFGGSTVIVLGEKGRFVPSSDILEQTQKGYETFVRLGAPIGKALGPA